MSESKRLMSRMKSFPGMRYVKPLVITALVLGLMLGAYVLWDYLAHTSSYPVPYLRTSPHISVSDDAVPVNGLCLSAHNASRESQRRGFLFFVANVSKETVRFDTRPFRLLEGMKAWAVDTKGKKHPVELRATYPEKDMPTRPVDVVTLRPGDRFSQSVIGMSPLDRISKISEALGPLYEIKHYVLSYEYAADGDLPEGIWHGKLISNPFQFNQIPLKLPKQFKQRSYPKELFRTRLNGLRYYPSRKDIGLPLLNVKHFDLLQHHSLLREGQFGQVLDAAMISESALIRAYVARHPKTWSTLLLDANDDVRRAALRAAATFEAYPRVPEIAPILATTYHEGKPEERLLALEALKKHSGGDALPGRTRIDLIRKAFKDPDEKVRKRASELFGHYMK